MAKKNSQRAKLALKARVNLLTKDIPNDYYLTVKSQRTLTLADLAREVAAMHGHQNASEVEMMGRELNAAPVFHNQSNYKPYINTQ